MSDLISRKAAINKLCEEWCLPEVVERCKNSPHRGEWNEDVYHCDGCDDIIFIKNLPSAGPEWIPCKERLPEKSDEYLITIGTQIYLSWFYKDEEDDEKWTYYDGNGKWSYKNADVIAWMPLPKPYKEGVEDENN